MSILTDFFGHPIAVGDRVAYCTGSVHNGFQTPQMGAVKAITADTAPDARTKVWATIEREVFCSGRAGRVKLADYEYDMTGRPIFLDHRAV